MNPAWERTLACLDGLSVGDAFGERLSGNAHSYVENRTPPPPPWPFTDDTQMALSVACILRELGSVDQERLAASFAQHYENWRGYGMAMHGLLARIEHGEHWLEASRSLFSGQGSFGNGAAMRVPPIGSYFADDLEAVVAQATLSAEVTHTHTEGIAGAIAVAVATALAWQLRETRSLPEAPDFLRRVLEKVPLSQVRKKLSRACDLGKETSLKEAVSELGNGAAVSAQDTVPFALWCAAHHRDNYAEALWFTAGAGGDCDTNCAIVGGIVVMCAGTKSIPEAWLHAREKLPLWPFG